MIQSSIKLIHIMDELHYDSSLGFCLQDSSGSEKLNVIAFCNLTLHVHFKNKF